VRGRVSEIGLLNVVHRRGLLGMVVSFRRNAPLRRLQSSPGPCRGGALLDVL